MKTLGTDQQVSVSLWRVLLSAVTALCVILASAPLTQAELATQQEMQQVARNWVTEIVYNTGDWAGTQNPEISDVIEITSDGMLLARQYNFSSGGFVVVPILKEMVPVKIYSEESMLDDLQEGGFLQLLRDIFSDRMNLFTRIYGSLDAVQSRDGDALFGRNQRTRWDFYALPADDFEQALTLRKTEPMDEVGPLLTTVWHQRAPYNDLCPMGDGGRCVVGCVATATAQILTYWQWPSSGIGSHSYYWDGDQSCGGDVGSGELNADYSDSYDWANIADECESGCTTAEEEALAELNYEVGVAFEMNYGACGSGAYTANALIVFPTYYKYKPDITRVNRDEYELYEWYNLMKTEIDSGRVAQYRISRHSIVMDGYRDNGGQYQCHMNYGWGGSFNTWFVLDSMYCYWEPDSLCPADEEYMITHIIPQDEPVISFVGQMLDDSGGDGDGHADVGESVELTVTIRNDGWDAGDVVAQLSSSDPFVTITSDVVSFGDTIFWGDDATSQTPFEFSISPICDDPHIVIFDLTINDGTRHEIVEQLYLFVGDTPGFEDKMESGEGYWTHEPVTMNYMDEWHLESHRAYDGGTSWKVGGIGEANYCDMLDAGLVTPPFLLPDNAELTFWHWIHAEIGDPGTAWDGGIVMISNGDGNWTHVTPEGGYPYTIIANPASPFDPDTPCFSGYQDWSQVEFDLSAYSGVVQLMFRFGSDGATTEEGWYVDGIKVAPPGCCVGTRGNVVLEWQPGDCDETDQTVDISDLTNLIDHLFISFTPYCCLEEVDIAPAISGGQSDDEVDILDLTGMIDHMFISYPPMPGCE